jgi:hypothetical protein
MVLDAPSGRFGLNTGANGVSRNPVEGLRLVLMNTPATPPGHSSTSSRITSVDCSNSSTLVESHSPEELSGPMDHPKSSTSMVFHSRFEESPSPMDHSGSSPLIESDSSSPMNYSNSSTLMEEEEEEEEDGSSEESSSHTISRTLPSTNTQYFRPFPTTKPFSKPVSLSRGGQPPLASSSRQTDPERLHSLTVRTLNPEATRLASSNSIAHLLVVSENKHSVKPNRQYHIAPKGNRISISGGNDLPVSEAAVKQVATRVKTVKGEVETPQFRCPASWCEKSFTRPGDAQRHFQNAAIHRPPTKKGSNTRCRKCGEELSRADARKRHELRDACGKRRIVHKPPGPPPFAPV